MIYYQHYRHHAGHQAADVGHPKPRLKMMMTWQLLIHSDVSIYSDVSDKQYHLIEHSITII